MYYYFFKSIQVSSYLEKDPAHQMGLIFSFVLLIVTLTSFYFILIFFFLCTFVCVNVRDSLQFQSLDRKCDEDYFNYWKRLQFNVFC